MEINVDPDPSEKTKENDKPEEGPGPMQNINQAETHSHENDDSENEEKSKSAWKHKSSHPLENFISPLNSGMQTRSKTRNLVEFSGFISTIDPKNVKEALSDAYWINSMQDE